MLPGAERQPPLVSFVTHKFASFESECNALSHQGRYVAATRLLARSLETQKSMMLLTAATPLEEQNSILIDRPTDAHLHL